MNNAKKGLLLYIESYALTNIGVKRNMDVGIGGMWMMVEVLILREKD